MSQCGPARREAALQTAEQYHQLGAVNTVPQEGGQQEEVEQGRHRRARARVRLHILLGGQDDVGVHVGLPGDLVLLSGVCHSGEEGDDEGQQGDVNAEQHHPCLDGFFRVPKEAEKMLFEPKQGPRRSKRWSGILFIKVCLENSLDCKVMKNRYHQPQNREGESEDGDPVQGFRILVILSE